MSNKTIKIFIASSSELQDDRNEFRNFIADESSRLNKLGINLDLIRWETAENAISTTRLQDEYNQAIQACDMVVFLIFSKVGKFTLEEFDTALAAFRDNPEMKIWTYFKNAPLYPESLVEADIRSLFAFKQKIRELGHFRTKYDNIYDLKFQFKNELEKVLPKVTRPEADADSGPERGTPSADPEEAIHYVFNELLIKRLLTAIQVYNDDARRILDNAARTTFDTDTRERFYTDARQNLLSSFVGVLGTQLVKLMAIGKEEPSGKKFGEYLKICHFTTKRALQLLCFVLISKLWDDKKEKSYHLSPAQTSTCVNFFEDRLDMNITALVHLLQTLVAIFEDNQVEWPMSELPDLLPRLKPGSSFLTACTHLQGIKEPIDKGTATEADCQAAEGELATFLECLNFMVNYRMISIKSIGYYEMRNSKPYYLYNFTSLGIDSKATNNKDKVNYAEAPANTDAVMLKGKNKKDLNLFPFIIDANSLASEGGAKICFYSYNDKGSLKYTFLEDNSLVSVTDNKTMAPGLNMNELLNDPQKFKAMRMDDVCNLFMEAKKTITDVGPELVATTDDNGF
jgi:hypothetical protein